MSWNYRVMRRVYDNFGILEPEMLYEIYEAYYDDDAVVDDAPNSGLRGWTENPVTISSEEGVEGVRWVLDKMREALDKPVLDYHRIGVIHE